VFLQIPPLQPALTWEQISHFTEIALPVGLSLYVLFSNRGREDIAAREKHRQDVHERLHKLENGHENHQNRFTGFSIEHERFCDTTVKRFEALDTRIGELNRLRETIVRLETNVSNMSEQMRSTGDEVRRMDSKLDQIIQLFAKSVK